MLTRRTRPHTLSRGPPPACDLTTARPFKARGGANVQVLSLWRRQMCAPPPRSHDAWILGACTCGGAPCSASGVHARLHCGRGGHAGSARVLAFKLRQQTLPRALAPWGCTCHRHPTPPRGEPARRHARLVDALARSHWSCAGSGRTHMPAREASCHLSRRFSCSSASLRSRVRQPSHPFPPQPTHRHATLLIAEARNTINRPRQGAVRGADRETRGEVR